MARLAAWLRTHGRQVVTCKDPGGTALGDRLRNILLEQGSTPISIRAEMLLFMASRAQLVEEMIAPALAEGRVVISDRYLLANIVYQGSAGGLIEEEIALVGMVATGGLLPDLTLVLDITPAAAIAPSRARPAIGSRTDRCFIGNGSAPVTWPPPEATPMTVPRHRTVVHFTRRRSF